MPTERYKLRPLQLVQSHFGTQTQRDLDRVISQHRRRATVGVTPKPKRGPVLSFDGSAEGAPLSPVSPNSHRARHSQATQQSVPSDISPDGDEQPRYTRAQKGKGRAGPPPVEPLQLPPAVTDAPPPQGEDQVRVPSPSSSGSSSSHYSTYYG